MMKTLKTNLAYGLIVIIPFAIIAVVLYKLVEITETIVTPLARQLGFDSVLGLGGAVILSILLLLFICFIIGALVRTSIGAFSFAKFEKILLERIPGYQIVSQIIKGFADDNNSFPRAMVQLYGEGRWVLAIIMEESADGFVTVFVPNSPILTIGTLHIVEKKYVSEITTSAMDFTDCVTTWGVGGSKIPNQRK